MIFILMIVVSVMPPGILIYAPHSEYKSMTECLHKIQTTMHPAQRPICAIMPPHGMPV